MFFAALTFLSAVSISLTAAYFSVIGLATMFPGSKEAIIIMGGVLEVGKLIASVWLHHNWNNTFRFLKWYLLFSVVILSLITSMGIFGFLSRSHVEHHASIDKEQAIISQIDDKISREEGFITRKKEQLQLLNSNENFQKDNSDDIIKTLQDRVESLKQEKIESISIQESVIDKLNNRLSALDKKLSESKPSGLFGSKNKYDELALSQKIERESINNNKSAAENKIQEISSDFDSKIAKTRDKIDSILSISSNKTSGPVSDSGLQNEIEEAYNRISRLEAEKFEYGSKLRALEVEIGPILYIANLLNEWGGVNVETSQAIRIVIITLIFVFDPLAILLLIASTMTYAQNKKEELPPDVKDIRNKLLMELEEYLNEGGLADHFIERAKK